MDDIYFDYLSPLSEALFEGDLSFVIGCIETDPDLIKGWDTGMGALFDSSPLTVACMGGQLEVVKWLLQTGAEPNNPVGRKPTLHWATYHSLEITKILLEAGADIMGKDEDGYTALHCLSLHWEKKDVKDGSASEIAQLLVKHGADVNDRNEWGGAPLHSLGPDHNAEFVRALVELGADVNTLDNNGHSPLDRLLDNISNPEGWTHPGQYYADSTANARSMAEEIRRHGGKEAKSFNRGKA